MTLEDALKASRMDCIFSRTGKFRPAAKRNYIEYRPTVAIIAYSRTDFSIIDRVTNEVLHKHSNLIIHKEFMTIWDDWYPVFEFKEFQE